MTSSKPPDDEPGSPSPNTPDPAVNDANDTVEGAPEAGGNGEGSPSKKTPAAARRRAATMKQPPSLLTDFLLGRQSPARIAADKQAAREALKRRKSLEEIKLEMRQAAVMKVQAPGRVRERVNKWQKAYAAAMADADPLAAPTEPSEVYLQLDDQSVTEEDRVRIKMRQKKKTPANVVVAQKTTNEAEVESKDEEDPKLSASPPKKRVVSDTNWVKNKKKKTPPRKPVVKTKQSEDTSSPLPKNFVLNPSPNPPVSRKIADWASKVEVPDETPKRYSAFRSNRSRSVGSGDGIRVRPIPDESDPTSRISGTIQTASTSESQRSRAMNDDGIRVRPLASKKRPDDESRAKSKSPALPDDGIRIRPLRPKSRDASTVRASSPQTSRVTSTGISDIPRKRSPSARVKAAEDKESTNSKTDDKAKTPTQQRSRKSRSQSRRTASHVDTETTMTQDVSDSKSWTSGSENESDRPSSVAPKSLADIPFGYSAFSELDLSTGRGRPSKPKTKRQQSFKGATNVLKKALNEGKKILTEKVEPPKPVAVNQPPNIENWLNDTIDPFVENQEEASREDPFDAKKARRSSSSSQPGTTNLDEPKIAPTEKQQSILESGLDEPDNEASLPPPSSGLKRSRATRIASSPIKSTAKKGFKEKFLDAFRGESTEYSSPLAKFSSPEKVIDDESDLTTDSSDQNHSSAPRRSRSPDDYSSSYFSTSSVSTEPSKKKLNPVYAKRRPPPTNGLHELSTIVSDAETLSTLESDLSSMLSDTTITQTATATGLTRSTAVSRKRSQKSGLKRRLTKHSDLVSALSLPDDNTAPKRSGSLRSAHSVRRASNHLSDANVESLLQEFIHDEDVYSRELKTLVDGVIPVLLSQFVNGQGNLPEDLFNSPKSSRKEDPLPKAVVNMGIALEKLKKHHRHCPLSNVHRLPQWLETITPIYESYLGVWRLGFQGIIVNLAPASPDDEDSLIGAMPRNEEGDVLNEDGDRIDVAHLLKRPLVRIKWITKFIQGYRTVTQTTEYETLASKWEALQEKTRKRHKEEVARVVDDDAKDTDTSLVRDLRTMAALDSVRIDRFRQVYAKDSFSLDLRHSNSQRLDCQVELVFRDNQLFKSDPGDLLIRENGSGGRSWLLFAPVTSNHLSARQGDTPHQLVVMIRGYKDEWFELLTLTADNEEQVEEWLGILGDSPVPPLVKDMAASDNKPKVLSPSSMASERPLGERRRQSSQPALYLNMSSPKETQTDRKIPSRYHQRHSSSPTTPISPACSASSDKTETQDGYSNFPPTSPLSPDRHQRNTREQRSHSSNLMQPKSTPYRDDGAPPPPVHRTLSTQKSPILPPPAEEISGLKRRGSSPLKHEYYPSDVSSESAFSTSESEGDGSLTDESSDDELEAADMPDTAPGISIKKETEHQATPEYSPSVISLTPSASASQTGIPKLNGKETDYLFQSLATISYWDNKRGCWKDLWPDTCSVITTPGLIEAYPYRRTHTSSGQPSQEEDRPLLALDLTPLVMLRNSTALDLEIRSPVLSYARLYRKVAQADSSFFRFRASSFQDCESLYMAVHRARLDNAKYKALEEETRIRAFGQNQQPHTEGDGSSHGRGWFGRKNSYRASTRAPSQSAGSTSHSSASASSFLKKLIGGGGQFNIAMSTVDRQHSRFASGSNSLYTSSSSGAPRSPSVSAANSGGNGAHIKLTTNNLKVRLHLLVSSSKWEDHGNCYLEVTRPNEGTRQNLRKYQGMEKRIIVTSIPKRGASEGRVILDVVLGSRCFSRLGSRGILLNVWEEVRNESGEMGVVPQGGGSGGNVNKWCFQCVSVTEASWIYGLVTQEVMIV
ncbi:hypothetical protein F5Y16DRAFT_45571 [Xylariaceae sp. FL0255]|nr:hypothetical protein F5Y16DRAFT_45571 [Xylariaceae sp. FL0255]